MPRVGRRTSLPDQKPARAHQVNEQKELEMANFKERHEKEFGFFFLGSKGAWVDGERCYISLVKTYRSCRKLSNTSELEKLVATTRFMAVITYILESLQTLQTLRANLSSTSLHDQLSSPQHLAQ